MNENGYALETSRVVLPPLYSCVALSMEVIDIQLKMTFEKIFFLPVTLTFDL